MKKAVIATMEFATGLMFWLIVLMGGFVGFSYSLSHGLGIPGVVAIAIGLLIGWFVAVLMTGLIYLLLSINEHLAALRETKT